MKSKFTETWPLLAFVVVLVSPAFAIAQTHTGQVASSPIIVDVSGNGFDLTDVGNGVAFDLDRDGSRERLSWTAAGSDDAFLVLDRDANGSITDGGELFGNFTPQPESAEPNGFAALAEFDRSTNGGNGDGEIDDRDAVFAALRLWQDANHNGISEAGELVPLSARGLTSFDLQYKESKRKDEHGNEFRYRAKVRHAHDSTIARWAWDVFFLRQ